MIWIACILLLIALLTVVKPPFYQAWLLSVAVAGLPWLFALLSLALLLRGSLYYQTENDAPAGLITAMCSGAAFILFCLPVLRAFLKAASLKKELAETFPLPENEQLPDPFRFWKMFTGPLTRKVAFQTRSYYKHAGCTLDLDLYPSQVAGVCPCIIVIHGGSWSSGDSRQLPELNSRLARSGYHVAAVNYRLAPRHQSPLAVNDVKNAIGFLRKNAADLKIDPTRFILLGRSAGGQIALQAAYEPVDPGIRGVIAYYTPADMVWGYSAPASRLIMDSCKVMEAYLGGSYYDMPENYRAASPVETLARHAPPVPTLLLHGKNDVLVAYEHSVRLASALRSRGTSHYLFSLPSGTHGFDYVLDGPEGQLATHAVRHFLKAVR